MAVDAESRATHDDHAVARSVNREQGVLGGRGHDRQGSLAFAVKHGAARADDPQVVPGAPDLEEAGHLTVGADTIIYPFACLGVAPQDLKYAGEPTHCAIGKDTTIREYVTISRGTVGGGGETTSRQDN